MLYNFFACHDRDTGGETSVWLGRSAFVRPAHVDKDRLLGPSGQDVLGERSLTYFLTHELTHVLTADAIGTWRDLELERWQQDRYADEVAKARLSALGRNFALVIPNSVPNARGSISDIISRCAPTRPAGDDCARPARSPVTGRPNRGRASHRIRCATMSRAAIAEE